MHGRIHPISQHFGTNPRRRTFAGLDALTPSVLKLGIAGVSALFEPITTAHAATALTRFLDRTAIGTHSCYHGG